jgi:CBS domain containing-hemolysin-like protein
MSLLLIYLTIALLTSFLCSLLEASLLSITPSHVSITQQQQPAIGKTLQHYKDNIDRPLAAILTLNTFAHTIGAAGVGAQAQLIWGEAYLTLVSIILTILILILTEIIPKTLGANYWRQLTGFTVRCLKVMIIVLYPLVLVSQFITKRLKKDKEKSVLSRADFTAMTEIGTQEGILEKSESTVIHNILKFNQIQAQHIMTPRTVIRAAREVISVMQYYDSHQSIPHSRIPIYEASIDHITGYVLKDALLQTIIEGQGDKLLKDIKRPIEIFAEQVPVPDIFTELMKKKEHIALVVDEYGGTAGILTIEDIVETLLGLEITDEYDDVEDLQQLAIERWQKRARRLGYMDDTMPEQPGNHKED